jgi:hypothetical protein
MYVRLQHVHSMCSLLQMYLNVKQGYLFMSPLRSSICVGLFGRDSQRAGETNCHAGPRPTRNERPRRGGCRKCFTTGS